MTSSVVNNDPITGLGQLHEVGTDEEVAMVPRGLQLRSWLIIGRSNAENGSDRIRSRL